MEQPTRNNNARGQWHGVAQIVRFNWRLYLGGIVALAAGGIALNFVALTSFMKWIALVCMGTTAFWMLTSLVASHWVYDRSAICRWQWISACLPQPPQRWANIHAGLDESSVALKAMFAGSDGEIMDIFDPSEMTEASIAEARRNRATGAPERRVDFREIPAENGEFDALFLLFAAHEIRHDKARSEFFAELARVLRPGGRVVIAEHLRDWKNFIAYGPGCFHFQSLGTWHRAAAGAKLKIENEFAITPFVRIFVLRKGMV
jgi:SAM-dependent methyltransferase